MAGSVQYSEYYYATYNCNYNYNRAPRVPPTAPLPVAPEVKGLLVAWASRWRRLLGLAYNEPAAMLTEKCFSLRLLTGSWVSICVWLLGLPFGGAAGAAGGG